MGLVLYQSGKAEAADQEMMFFHSFLFSEEIFISGFAARDGFEPILPGRNSEERIRDETEDSIYFNQSPVYIRNAWTSFFKSDLCVWSRLLDC